MRSVGSDWCRYYDHRDLGSRHSFSGIADSDELVSLESMPHDVTIDEQSEYHAALARRRSSGTTGSGAARSPMPSVRS